MIVFTVSLYLPILDVRLLDFTLSVYNLYFGTEINVEVISDSLPVFMMGAIEYLLLILCCKVKF